MVFVYEDDASLPWWKIAEKKRLLVDPYGWTNIESEQPDACSEVVVFYVAKGEEGTCNYNTEIMNGKFIDAIDSPILYWINKPE